MFKKTITFDSAYFNKQKELSESVLKLEKINQNKIKILSCPCCGEKSNHFDNFERHTIECSKCGMQTPVKNTFESCLKIWNNRN